MPIAEHAAQSEVPLARERQAEIASAWNVLARVTGRVLTIGGLVAASAALLLVAASTLPTLLGYHTFVIDGGSMGPSLSLGSVAVTAPTNPATLETGDVIAYRSSPQSPPVLHRIVSITERDGHRLFTTQGDRNETADPTPVRLDGLGDKVIYDVPFAGYILNFARDGVGRALLIGLPLALLSALFVAQIRRLARPAQPQTAWQPGPEAAPVPPLSIIAGRVEEAAVANEPAPASPRLKFVVPASPARESDDLPAFLVGQLRRQRRSRPVPSPAVTPLPVRPRTGGTDKRVAA